MDDNARLSGESNNIGLDENVEFSATKSIQVRRCVLDVSSESSTADGDDDIRNCSPREVRDGRRPCR
jgi:hypothetical protein